MAVILMIGLDDLIYRDIRIAAAGVGVFLRDVQPHRFPGTEVSAGQTGLAVSGDMYRSAVLYTDGGGGADPGAQS